MSNQDRYDRLIKKFKPEVANTNHLKALYFIKELREAVDDGYSHWPRMDWLRDQIIQLIK